MALSLTPYTVASLETSSATKFNNTLSAIESYVNTLLSQTLLTAKGDIYAASGVGTVTRLAVGTDGQVLTAASGQTTGLQWSTPATPTSATLTTSLPGSPTNDQEIVLTDSTTVPTYYWALRYNSTSAKWHFIGGSPIYAEVTTAETTSSTSYAALATAGPAIALPIAGDYMVAIGARASATGGTTSAAVMSYDIGGVAAVDADSGSGSAFASGSSFDISFSAERKKAGLTAVTLTAKYKQTGTGPTTFQSRWMQVIPVRVG